MTWTAKIETIDGDRGSRYQVLRGDRPVSLRATLRAWQEDAAFRAFFLATLAEAPYRAFRWETPAATLGTADRPFAFVLLDSPGLDRPASQRAFSEHFEDPSTDGVVAFPNLGGDGIMIVPAPRGPDAAYGHLAAFVRNAPEEQRHALWCKVGAVMEASLGPEPRWLSTAGGGVPWLHVRIDQRPKYYGYAPYRRPI